MRVAGQAAESIPFLIDAVASKPSGPPSSDLGLSGSLDDATSGMSGDTFVHMTPEEVRARAGSAVVSDAGGSVLATVRADPRSRKDGRIASGDCRSGR